MKHLMIVINFPQTLLGTLFRGFSEPETKTPPEGWFALSADDAELYGRVKCYESKNLHFLNMADVKSVQLLHKVHLARIQVAKKLRKDAVQSAYPIVDGVVRRDSEHINDHVVVATFKWGQHHKLLNQNLSGFGNITPMAGHHLELFIQRAPERLRFLDFAASTMSDMDLKRMRLKRKTQRARRKSKVRSRYRFSDMCTRMGELPAEK